MKGEEEEEEEKKKRKPRKVWIHDFEYGNHVLVWRLLVYGNHDDFIWKISRVLLGIHPNPRFVESWVGKTLVCIR